MESSQGKKDFLFFDCKYCFLGFSSKDAYEKHIKYFHPKSYDMETCRSKEVTQCKYCDKLFHHPDSLTEHLKLSHLQINNFKCSKCKFVTLNLNTLQTHINEVHREELKFKCIFCDQSFSSESSVKVHIEIEHRASLVKMGCPECTNSYSEKNSLNKHLMEIHGQKYPSETQNIKCSICATFWADWQIVLHIKICHSDSEINGGTNKHNENFEGLDNSLKWNITQCSERYCNTCKLVFDTKDDLNKHSSEIHYGHTGSVDMETPSEPVPVTKGKRKCKISCPECDMSFFSRSTLNKHLMQTHGDKVGNKDQNMECAICHTYWERWQISLHMKVCHQYKNPEEPASISENIDKIYDYSDRYCKKCKLVFRCKADLKDHINQRHLREPKRGKSQFSCSKCNKLFPNEQLLEEHIASCFQLQENATKERTPRLGCPECKKAFVERSSLNKHLMTTHGQKKRNEIQNVQCHSCDTFLEQWQLNLHIRICHSVLHHDSNAEDSDNYSDEDIIDCSERYCQACKMVYSDKLVFREHIKEMHLMLPRKGSQNLLKDHMLQSHPPPNDNVTESTNWSCPECNQPFADRNLLNKHLMEQHGDKEGNQEQNVRCKICGTYWESWQMRLHMRVCHSSIVGNTNDPKAMSNENERIEAVRSIACTDCYCNKCKIVYSNRSTLKAHIKEVHLKQSIPTEKKQPCNKHYLDSNETIDEHQEPPVKKAKNSEFPIQLENQNNSENFDCFKAETLKDLPGNEDISIEPVNDIQTFNCNLCDKNFPNKSKLNFHTKILHRKSFEERSPEQYAIKKSSEELMPMVDLNFQSDSVIEDGENSSSIVKLEDYNNGDLSTSSDDDTESLVGDVLKDIMVDTNEAKIDHEFIIIGNECDKPLTDDNHENTNNYLDAQEASLDDEVIIIDNEDSEIFALENKNIKDNIKVKDEIIVIDDEEETKPSCVNASKELEEQCDLPGSTFQNNDSFQENNDSPTCIGVETNLTNLLQAIKDENEEDYLVFECSICEEEFDSKELLNHHMDTRHQPDTSSLTGASFSLSNALAVIKNDDTLE